MPPILMNILTSIMMSTHIDERCRRSLYNCLLAILIFFSGCSKSINSEAPSTLATGVTVVDSNVCNASDLDSNLKIAKKDGLYIVDLSAELGCEVNSLRPFVSPPIDHKATLVLSSGGVSGSSGCECSRKVQISIKDRLDAGDTLYVLNGDVVIGHVTVP